MKENREAPKDHHDLLGHFHHEYTFEPRHEPHENGEEPNPLPRPLKYRIEIRIFPRIEEIVPRIRADCGQKPRVPSPKVLDSPSMGEGLEF